MPHERLHAFGTSQGAPERELAWVSKFASELGRSAARGRGPLQRIGVSDLPHLSRRRSGRARCGPSTSTSASAENHVSSWDLTYLLSAVRCFDACRVGGTRPELVVRAPRAGAHDPSCSSSMSGSAGEPVHGGCTRVNSTIPTGAKVRSFRRKYRSQAMALISHT